MQSIAIASDDHQLYAIFGRRLFVMDVVQHNLLQIIVLPEPTRSPVSFWDDYYGGLARAELSALCIRGDYVHVIERSQKLWLHVLKRFSPLALDA